MGFFKSQRSSKSQSVVAGELGRVTAFGRFQLDPQSIDPSDFGMLEADLYPVATADPARFCADLASLVQSTGGVASYGGARLVGSLLSWECRDPKFLAMLDAALEWRHSLGTAGAWVAPVEMRRWMETHDSW